MTDDLPHARLRRTPASALAIALLAAAPFAQAQGLFGALTASKPERIELTDGADKADAFLKAASPGGLAPSAKVAEVTSRRAAVGAVLLEFVTQQAGRAGARGSSDVEKLYTLKGVDEKQLQAVVDAATAQLRAQLQARGYEVLAPEALAATSYKTELATADDGPKRFDEGQTLAGSLRSVGLGGGARGGPADNTAQSVTLSARGLAPKVFDGLGGSFSPCMKAADELGAVVLQLRLKVGFMQIDDTGSWGYSEVDGKPRDMLAAQGTRMDVCIPGGKLARYQLHKPVALPGKLATQVTEIQLTDAEKATATAKVAGNALLGFLGGKGGGGLAGAAGAAADSLHSQGGSGKFDVTADPAFADILKGDLALGTAMLIEALPR